jgi:hypothetical protein
MSDTYVAVCHPGERYHNTIVLGDIEVVIPLEGDLDDDPDTLDCVRLRHQDGLYEATLTEGSPGVEPDGQNPLNRYHFPAAVPGPYTIEVKVGDTWHAVARDVNITRNGAHFEAIDLEGDADGSVMGTPDDSPFADLDDSDDPDYGRC